MKARPPGAISDSRTRVLLAVLTGCRSVRAVGLATGMRSPNSPHRHLLALRDEGLVAFEPGTNGTLRPLVRRVVGHGRPRFIGDV